MVDLTASILAASLPLSTPILYAALGEVYAERSGVLNLGVEGVMGLSAFVSVASTYLTGSLAWGFIAALAAGGLSGLIHSVVSVKIGINQLIAGLMLYTLAGGIADFGYRRLTSVSFPLIPTLQPLNLSWLGRYGTLGQDLQQIFEQNVLVYSAFALAVGLGLILYKTTWGLKIRSVGENPEASDAAGVNVNFVRHICVISGGVLAGVAGASMTLGYLGIYLGGDALVAGRGWIAIVVVIFARWSPYRAILGSWIFGLGFSVAATLIGAGVGAGAGQAASSFLNTIPYVFALVIILIFHKGTRPPSSLTVHYRRK